jgi:hypothetical protein
MSRCSPTPTGQWIHRRCAYEQTQVAMGQLQTNDPIGVDVDIPAVANLVFGKLPGIRALRSTVASSLSDFDMRTIDRLDLYLRSMCYAHWLYQSTRVPIDRLREWLAEWPSVYERLVTEAKCLVSRASVDGCGIRLCPNRAHCHHNLSEPQRLCCLLHLNICHVEQVTTLRRYEIAQAELLAEIAAIAMDHGGDLSVIGSVTRMNRQRALTLFLVSYDQVRRATQFIRWSMGDADAIAPALERQAPRRRLDSCPPQSMSMPIACMPYDEDTLEVARHRSAS